MRPIGRPTRSWVPRVPYLRALGVPVRTLELSVVDNVMLISCSWAFPETTCLLQSVLASDTLDTWRIMKTINGESIEVFRPVDVW